MDRLLTDGIVDRVEYAPEDVGEVSATFKRWFSVDATDTHAANGQQLFATLHGFDACNGQYILQLDSDLLIGRADVDYDYLADMMEVFEQDRGALFVPLSISRKKPLPYTASGRRGDWRVEVRGCLFDKERVDSVLPIPNTALDGTVQTAWHRAFDDFIRSSDYRSYRGGDPRTCAVHVPNEWKSDPEELFVVVDRIEHGHIPPAQFGMVDLQRTANDWMGPKRKELFVFIIAGRNVDPGRFKQCFDSLAAQTDDSWGAVLIDDASDNGFGEYAELLASSLRNKITLIRNHSRKGLLRNTWEAVTRYCDDPESVIITLDADDALIGAGVLTRIREGYERGADATGGSMLRLDKEATYVPNLEDPRGNRGGAVWQHLRTFKKRLFDAIRVNDLKFDGEWIELANDWAFMLPIVEMAMNPVHISAKHYLYEPANQRDPDYVDERDRVIARIVSRPQYE